MAKKSTKVARNVKGKLNLIVSKFKLLLRKTVVFSERKPLLSFFAFLGIIVFLIVLSNIVFKPRPADTHEARTVKNVSVYRIGSAPRISVSAKVRKSGVIEITSLSGGIIDQINVSEGSNVKSGTNLLSMGTNYKGENSFSVQKQIANTQYQTAASTYNAQKEVIDRQIEIAEKTQENSDELRKITEASVSETQALVDQNEDILNILNDQINTLVQNNAPQDQILAVKQQRSQFLASTNQAKSALRNSQYSADSDNPSSEIAELTKEVTKRQLDVQKKQLALSLEVSRLQSRIAAINESLMFPSAPFDGVVQRVFVKEGQQVTPGTPLLVLSQSSGDKPVTAVAFVSSDIARRLSRLEASTLHIGDKAIYTALPSFVSTEAVQGTLYAVYYPIPTEYHDLVVSEGFITVDIPIGYPDTSMIATYVPIDAVYQTRDSAYVFVAQGNKVKGKTVRLGYVYGRFVEVTSGLSNGDAIILNRNIIEGDTVKTD